MKKYLPLYKKWMKTGELPVSGLCSAFHGDRLFNLIDPENGQMDTYWGYDGLQTQHTWINDQDLACKFTPFRQTIVLLMAAMNNEL